MDAASSSYLPDEWCLQERKPSHTECFSEFEENPPPVWVRKKPLYAHLSSVFVYLVRKMHTGRSAVSLQHCLFNNSSFFVNGKVVILWTVQNLFDTLIQVLQSDEILCILL